MAAVEKILQMVAPAQPAFAVIRNGNEPKFVPVALWVLVELEDGSRDVVGMEAGRIMDFCEHDDDFLGYAPTDSRSAALMEYKIFGYRP